MTLALREVRKSYGSAEVLHGVSLKAGSGEVVAIIGKSGSGKSTLLRCLNQLERVDAGSIYLDGSRVCSDVNGYFYAKNSNEINETISGLLGRTKKITDAAQGLVLSHQIFYDGRDEL